MLDGRDVVVRDDAVARPVVLDGRRELPGKPARIPRSRLHELVCGLGSYAQRCDDVVMGVLELWRYLLLPQGLYVLLFSTVGCLGERLVVQPGRVPSGVAQDALELPSARVGGVAQEAVRARDVLADLGRLLGCHATAGDEEDKPEDHDKEEEGTYQGEPCRKRPLAAILRTAAGSPGTTRWSRTARLRGGPVRSTLYTKPPRTCRGRGGTRTPTASRPLDPEPSASTNSATRPQALSGKRRKLRGIVSACQHFSTLRLTPSLVSPPPPCGRLLVSFQRVVPWPPHARRS